MLVLAGAAGLQLDGEAAVRLQRPGDHPFPAALESPRGQGRREMRGHLARGAFPLVNFTPRRPAHRMLSTPALRSQGPPAPPTGPALALAADPAGGAARSARRSARFRDFLACIALGVAAITGVGSVSLSLKDGLAREGRAILGGDLPSICPARGDRAGAARSWPARGRLSRALMRAMARATADGRGGGAEAAMVDIKAVDALYPLAGAVRLDPGMPLAEALAERDGAFGVAVDAALPPRLGARRRRHVSIGDGRYRFRRCWHTSRTSSPAASASGRAS